MLSFILGVNIIFARPTTLPLGMKIFIPNFTTTASEYSVKVIKLRKR